MQPRREGGKIQGLTQDSDKQSTADMTMAGPCTFWEAYNNEDLKQTGQNYKSIYCMNIPKTKANLSTPSKSACSMAITPTSANNCSG